MKEKFSQKYIYTPLSNHFGVYEKSVSKCDNICEWMS